MDQADAPTTTRHLLAGVGLALSACDDGSVLVNQLVNGSAAYASGMIRAGDVLEAVDNFAAEGASLSELSALVLGEPGSTVELTLRRSNEIFCVALVRNMVASNEPTCAAEGVYSHLTGAVAPDIPTELSNLFHIHARRRSQRQTLSSDELRRLQCFDLCHTETSFGSDGLIECMVCLDDLKDGDRVCSVPCPGKHLFHATCIQTWLSEGAATCPCDQHDIQRALKSP